MINGTSEIINGVHAQHLDPLLLAKSQTINSLGFIMIAYDHDLNLDASSFPVCNSIYYDLFFFNGALIYDCVRLNQDLRFTLNMNTALKTFYDQRENPGTSIYLYTAAEDILNRFRSTFYYEPCLKVQIEALSKKQISTLLKSSRCRRGIVECNEFINRKPSIELCEINSPEQLYTYEPLLKHGRLLLYDIDKNKEIIRERFLTTKISADAVQSKDNKVYTIPSSFKDIPLSVSVQSQIQNIDNNVEDDESDKIDPAEFTQFIQQILNSPMSKESKEDCRGESTQQNFVINVVDKEQNEIPDLFSKENIPNISGESISAVVNETQKKISSKAVKKKEQSKKPLNLETKKVALRQTVEGNTNEYIRIYERLFRSFRQRAFECFGAKCEFVISQAESRVRFLIPEFDIHNLTDETVTCVLDLLVAVIENASFLKRSRLRQATITLISDLYNKQYLLLEQHQAIDKIEQLYYKLKS